MKKQVKPKRKVNFKKKAKELALPNYARPKALAAKKEAIAARAEHVAAQDASYRRNEIDRLTAQLSGNIQPSLRQDLMAQRSKLVR